MIIKTRLPLIEWIQKRSTRRSTIAIGLTLFLIVLIFQFVHNPIPIRTGNLVNEAISWTKRSWQSHGTVEIDTSVTLNDRPSIRIADQQLNDISYVAEVPVVSGRYYRFSAWLKSTGINGDVGANLSAYGTYQHSLQTLLGDNQWQRIEQVFRACKDEVIPFALRLGYWGHTSRGTVWFNDVQLHELDTWNGPYEVLSSGDDQRESSVPFRLFYLFLVIPYILLFIYAVQHKLCFFSNSSADSIEPNLPIWQSKQLWGFILLALTIRLIVAPYTGFSVDLDLFKNWALELSNPEPMHSIGTTVLAAHYSPFYMYFLNLAGWLAKMCCWENSPIFTMLIKLPSIAVDLVIVVAMLKLLGNWVTGHRLWLIAAALAFNPAMVFDSSFWGQTEAIYVVFVLFALLFMQQKKMIQAGLMLSMSFAIKPQAIIFMLFFGIFLLRFYPWRYVIKTITASVVFFIVLVLPFALTFSASWIFDVYVGLDQSNFQYSYNAYNFWALLGLNTISISAKVLGQDFRIWSIAVPLFVFSLVSSIGLLQLPVMRVPGKVELGPSTFESRSAWLNTSLFPVFFLLGFALFLFFPGMHARYLYPVLIFMLPLLLRGKFYQWVYLIVSILFLINQSIVFYYLVYLKKLPPVHNVAVTLISLAMVLIFVVCFIYELNERSAVFRNAFLHVRSMLKRVMHGILDWIQSRKSDFTLTVPTRSLEFKAHDYAVMGLIFICALSVYLYRIGDRVYPNQSYLVVDQSIELEVEFAEPQTIVQINYYDGLNDSDIKVDYWHSEQWVPLYDDADYPLKLHDFYKTVEKRLKKVIQTSRLRLNISGKNSYINEIAVFGFQDHPLIPKAVIERSSSSGFTTPEVTSAQQHRLFDEQNKVRLHGGYLANTFYDEIYHGRTAYEFVERLPPYENTHPQFGKSLIAIGIRLFGMSPFGMRVIPAVFGALTVVLMFVAGGLITGKRFGAYLATVFSLLEFSMYTRSREANVDVILVFFILATALCLFHWYQLDSGRIRKANLKWYFLAGASIGCAISTKWNALYAGLGIFLFVCTLLVQQSKRAVYAFKNSDGLSYTTEVTKIKNLLMASLVGFVMIPILIYYLSFYEFIVSSGSNHLFSLEGLKQVIQLQANMLHYHSQLTDSHPYGSAFYSWPFIGKPLWLYNDYHITPPYRSTISLMGNPVLWWVGLVSMLVLLWTALKHCNRVAVLLVSSYLAMYLPWMTVERVTFIYHYYPCVPFMILAIAYLGSHLDFSRPKIRILTLAFILQVVFMFGMFYPAISGYPAFEEYFNALHWFTGWGHI